MEEQTGRRSGGRTARLQARSDSLQKLTDEFLTIFNGIPDSLLLLSPELKILWANPGAAPALRPPGGGTG